MFKGRLFGQSVLLMFVRWYLYRAIDSGGDTIEFLFSEHRNLPAAKRFLGKAFARHGRPDRITIDGSQTNHEAIASCDLEDRLRDSPLQTPRKLWVGAIQRRGALHRLGNEIGLIQP